MTGTDEDGPAVADAERPSRVRAVVGTSLMVVVLGAAGYAVYDERHDFVRALRHIGVGTMIGSYLLGLVGVGVTYLAWRAVLSGLGVTFPMLAGARVFFVSQLGKYLPGSVWPVVMQMEAGRARGASRRTMLAANLITILIGCTAGLLLAGAVLPFADAEALRRYWPLLLALPFLLALMHPRAIPWALDRVFGLLRRQPMNERLPPGDSLRAGGFSVASSVFQGLHVAVLVLALGGGTAGIWLAVGGMAMAVAGGVLFIPAPAGAGIRDTILVLVLSQALTRADALAVVIASRVLLILVDLTLAAVTAVTVARPRVTATTDQVRGKSC